MTADDAVDFPLRLFLKIARKVQDVHGDVGTWNAGLLEDNQQQPSNGGEAQAGETGE